MLNHVDVREIVPEEPGSPLERHGQSPKDGPALPSGIDLFSADNHISISEDIFYERFPSKLKDRAPRIWAGDGVYHIGIGGKSFYPPAVVDPLAQFEGRPGAASNDMDARMADLDSEGVRRELAFQNGVLVLCGFPDLEARSLCIRIYNEYLAELQDRAPGRFYGVGLISWWDAQAARADLAQLKALGIRTFLLPLRPGVDADGELVDYTSDKMRPVWEAIADSGVPVSHHIGEFPLKTQYNSTIIGFVHNVATFREMFGSYVMGGILDRHPQLRIGWFEGGINWVPAAIQDCDHAMASYRHIQDWKILKDAGSYWREHMYSSFIVDPLGLRLLDLIGADQVMWASDYPHNESTFGYTRSSIRSVAESVDKAELAPVLGGNVARFLDLPVSAI